MARKNAINDLIVVIYLPIKNQSIDSVYQVAKEASATIKRTIPEARVIAVPDPTSEVGRVECINPKLVGASEWEKVEKKVNEMEFIVENLVDALNPLTKDLKLEPKKDTYFEEKKKEIDSLTENLTDTEIVVSAFVASFFQDAQEFEHSNKVERLDKDKPYFVGKYKQFNVNVNPHLPYDDLTIYDSADNVLVNLKDHNFKISDLV